jgi:DNA-binding MarR family transcriptional regulator/N-acetylglutamate synthase-like GNAT family acetyltransferase
MSDAAETRRSTVGNAADAPRTIVDDAAEARRIAAVRRFNRFYTRRIGVLRRRLYASPLSLTEVRVLYELAHRDAASASAMVKALDLDPGYLSRLLQGFERQGWVRRTRSSHDGRQHHVALTAAGRRAFAPLERESQEEAAALLAGLAEDGSKALVDSMATIERLLQDAPPRLPAIVLRGHRPGDIGWVIERHGALYAREYGWDERFEALVAGIAARFIERLDPARERCWIAERDGERVGCVFVVRRAATVAQLRLLLVEPSARGIGLGKRLVDECLAFARSAGYRRMRLWTNAGLDAARGIYESRGFCLTHEEPHHSFGHALVGQTFELTL